MFHEILTDATIVWWVYPSGRSLRFLVDTDDVVRWTLRHVTAALQLAPRGRHPWVPVYTVAKLASFKMLRIYPSVPRQLFLLLITSFYSAARKPPVRERSRHFACASEAMAPRDTRCLLNKYRTCLYLKWLHISSFMQLIVSGSRRESYRS